MDAAKGQRLRLARRPREFILLAAPGSAPAELTTLVEEKLPRALPLSNR
jgi:hypothetical protein